MATKQIDLRFVEILKLLALTRILDHFCWTQWKKPFYTEAYFNHYNAHLSMEFYFYFFYKMDKILRFSSVKSVYFKCKRIHDLWFHLYTNAYDVKVNRAFKMVRQQQQQSSKWRANPLSFLNWASKETSSHSQSELQMANEQDWRALKLFKL